MSDTATPTAAERAQPLIDHAMIALVEQLRAEGIPDTIIAAQLIAAGLMKFRRTPQDDIRLTMNGVVSQGTSTVQAMVNWLNIARAQEQGEIAIEGAISGARLQ